jgi:hypothetical protein
VLQQSALQAAQVLTLTHGLLQEELLQQQQDLPQVFTL